MPPRCPVPRPALRPAPSSQDGIWITDAMLIRAIERYGRVSTASVRHLSSLPGPLESRRRLGKRHMAGIMSQSHGAPPPWLLDIPWQIGEWKWEAPTTPERRKLERGGFSLRRKIDQLIGWLESPDDVTPLTHTPPTIQSTIPTALEQTVFSYRQQIKELIVSERFKEVESLCLDFRRDLANMMHLRMVTSADLLLAFNLLDSDIREHVYYTPRWDGVTARIGRTIIESIAKTRSTPRHDVYGADFWSPFIKQVCQLAPQKDTFNLFALCMDTIPVPGLYQDDLFEVTKSFIAHKANSPKVKPTTYSEFMKAFARLKDEAVGEWRNRVIAFLRALPEDDRRRRFYGILLLAHHHGTSTDQFLQASGEIFNGTVWGLEEAFWILKGRLWAWKCVASNNLGAWLRSTADGQGWTTLITLIWHQPNEVRWRLLNELCRLTHGMGCFEALADALAREIPERAFILRSLALASDNYQQALQLWQALHAGSSSLLTPKPGSWDWTAWSPYVEKMIRDPEVNHELIWKVLCLDSTTHNIALPDRVTAGIKSKTQLLDMMSGWYLEASHLSDRQVVRRIQNCIVHHQRINKTVSRTLIENMTQAVLREMERGSLAPGSRLDYLVSLIRKHLGAKEAEAASTQIRGWSWTIKNRSATAGLKHKAPRKPTKIEAHRQLEKSEPRDTAEGDMFAQMRYLRKESA